MKSQKITLVIMAAGLGSRYGGNKQLASLTPQGYSLLDFSVYDAIKAGFDQIVFVIHPNMDPEFPLFKIPDYQSHIETNYVIQQLNNLPQTFSCPRERRKPWGTGHALLSAKEYLNHPFAVINADDYYGASAYSMMAQFLKATSPNQHAMMGYELENTLSENGSVSRGICKADQKNDLSAIDERKGIIQQNGEIYANDYLGKTLLSPNDITSMNFWGFGQNFTAILETAFIDFLKHNKDLVNEEFYLPYAVQKMIKDQYNNVHILATQEKWFGLTYQEDKPAVIHHLDHLTKAGKYPEQLF